ncbi:MAG: internal scaffolding protein [Microvirus sp.]|nr:MAG: internal scaffolding protein [Microvirus sp.]
MKDANDKKTKDYITETKTWPEAGYPKGIKIWPTPTIRAAYSYDADALSDETGLQCQDKSKTQQNAAEECDINTIVKRFNLTGQLPQNVRMPQSGDFTNVPSFQQAMDALVSARESFDAMPAHVRARFHNDPGEFVAFCDDEENLEEARKLGLVPAKELVNPPDPKKETEPKKEGPVT